MVTFESSRPILRVDDLQRSLDYYTRLLGFTVDFHDPGIIASVSRDRAGVWLVEGDQGHAGGWVWFGVDDVEPLYEEWRGKGGVKIRLPPTNYCWAREMQLEDPDGNVLRFGSEPDESAPLGVWLDMRGVRWAPVAGGGWRRVGVEN